MIFEGIGASAVEDHLFLSYAQKSILYCYINESQGIYNIWFVMVMVTGWFTLPIIGAPHPHHCFGFWTIFRATQYIRAFSLLVKISGEGKGKHEITIYSWPFLYFEVYIHVESCFTLPAWTVCMNIQCYVFAYGFYYSTSYYRKKKEEQKLFRIFWLLYGP